MGSSSEICTGEKRGQLPAPGTDKTLGSPETGDLEGRNFTDKVRGEMRIYSP